MAGESAVIDVMYIEATAERVWDALTDADLTASYWGHSNVSDDWQVGSEWRHVRLDGSGVADVVGRVVESDRPRRLVTTWALPDGGPDAPDASRVTFAIEAFDGIVRLTVTHEGLGEADRREAAHGWAAVLSNLKTRIETGHALPRPPWDTPRD